MAISIGDLNPFSDFDIGVGAVGNALILFAIFVVIVGLVGWLVWWRISSRQYKFKIPLYKSINGTNFKQADYVAKNVSISKAGDSLWFVKGLKKFIAPATLTSALHTYPHEERDDGEWINFSIDSVNEQQKKAGVQFIQQDMRTQRVATGQILEQRLINKGFWEKYKDMIVSLVFYVITCLLMVVIFYQWSDIVDKTSTLVESLKGFECIGRVETGIVPAMILFLFKRKGR